MLCLIKTKLTLNRVIFVILYLLVLSSCSDGAKYIKQNDGINHLIDLGQFSLITPADFRYKKQEGIDSYVGKITNGQYTFYFDYGWYSPKPPLTKKQFISKNSKSLDFESSQLFFNLIDLKPYKNKNGGVNPMEITKEIKNLSLNKLNDSVNLSTKPIKKPEYYYSFQFENKEYKIPFYGVEQNTDYFKYYKIKTDTIGKYQRTISIWNNSDLENYSSVNLIPLTEISKSELWLGISSEDKMELEEIERILKSVKIKKN